MPDPLRTCFDPAVADWFETAFPSVAAPQRRGWPAIARGESTLILAPTGSGKTLAAFLWSLNPHSRPRPVRGVPDRRRQGQGARRRARRGNGV